MPRVLALRQSSFYVGLERLMVESAAALGRLDPAWQVDLLQLYTRRGLTDRQRAALPAAHPLVAEARARGLRAWQWEDAGKLVPRQWAELLRFVRAGGYDIIHTHDHKTDLMGVMLQRVAPVRAVATAHGYHPNAMRRQRLYRWLDLLALRQYDQVITVSDGLRAEMARAGLRPERLTTIHNAIDVAAFRAQGAVPADLGVGAGPVVMAVARFIAEKRLDIFLAAAARVHSQIPTARFVLVGDGPLRPALEAQARAAGLDGAATFLGYRRDVAALMAASDLVVLSSDYEGCPMVLMEAQALGKPVVATRIPGVDEIVEHEATGLLVPPGAPDALAAAMARLLTDDSLASALARGGARRVESSFDVHTVARRTRAVYERVGTGNQGLRSGD